MAECSMHTVLLKLVPGPNIMEPTGLHVKTHKISKPIQSSRLTSCCRNVRWEYNSKAINLTGQFGLQVCLHKENFSGLA